MSASVVIRLVVSTLGGLLVGGAFFALLRLNVRLYTSRRWPVGIGLHLARWALLVVTLVLAARVGALSLLAVAGGTLVARMALVRGTVKASP